FAGRTPAGASLPDGEPDKDDSAASRVADTGDRLPAIKPTTSAAPSVQERTLLPRRLRPIRSRPVGATAPKRQPDLSHSIPTGSSTPPQPLGHPHGDAYFCRWPRWLVSPAPDAA